MADIPKNSSQSDKTIEDWLKSKGLNNTNYKSVIIDEHHRYPQISKIIEQKYKHIKNIFELSGTPDQHRSKIEEIINPDKNTAVQAFLSKTTLQDQMAENQEDNKFDIKLSECNVVAVKDAIEEDNIAFKQINCLHTDLISNPEFISKITKVLGMDPQDNSNIKININDENAFIAKYSKLAFNQAKEGLAKILTQVKHKGNHIIVIPHKQLEDGNNEKKLTIIDHNGNINNIINSKIEIKKLCDNDQDMKDYFEGIHGKSCILLHDQGTNTGERAEIVTNTKNGSITFFNFDTNNRSSKYMTADELHQSNGRYAFAGKTKVDSPVTLEQAIKNGVEQREATNCVNTIRHFADIFNISPTKLLQNMKDLNDIFNSTCINLGTIYSQEFDKKTKNLFNIAQLVATKTIDISKHFTNISDILEKDDQDSNINKDNSSAELDVFGNFFKNMEIALSNYSEEEEQTPKVVIHADQEGRFNFEISGFKDSNRINEIYKNMQNKDFSTVTTEMKNKKDEILLDTAQSLPKLETVKRSILNSRLSSQGYFDNFHNSIKELYTPITNPPSQKNSLSIKCLDTNQEIKVMTITFYTSNKFSIEVQDNLIT